MMKNFCSEYFTSVAINPPDPLFKKEGGNLFMGSCFTENLYNYYKNHFIDSLFSPFGNIYNPVSLANSLVSLAENRVISSEDVFLNRELWRHFDFDSRMCTTDKKQFLLSINNSLQTSSLYLKQCKNLFITLGTSFVYRLKVNDSVVNNCHKLKGDSFKREILSIEEMKLSMSEALKKVLSVNDKLKIIMTLSPVRHLRDNPEENSLSKARLRCLIYELASEFNIWYFPSYEIMFDELRDYRWYDRDLVHPSAEAVELIMNRFVESAADTDFKQYVKETGKLRSMLNHRILHNSTDEAGAFVSATEKRFSVLAEKYPSMSTLQMSYSEYRSSHKGMTDLSLKNETGT